MTFFVTSETHSGDLGGLEGPDVICQRLATEVDAGDYTWRAYLSAHGMPVVGAVVPDHARDRIGNGTWYNAKGVLIAASLADLHGDIQRDSNSIYRETALTEKGQLVNGRVRPEGTNKIAEGSAMIGYHDRVSSWNTSWNSSHATNGCSLELFNETGGAGRFYCFAED
ncbi:MAG: hypothetical protein P8J68_06500 [Arenicellaceae bacterium]|nr:hypothetical protein [Arenicellaceae bacterium]